MTSEEFLFVEFAKARGLELELCPQQNFHPDLTFIETRTGPVW
jgi:hypothetical protein